MQRLLTRGSIDAGAAGVTGQLSLEGLSIAVLIPCYNEVVTIAQVIKDFRQALPSPLIYVYDNNSTDGPAAAAAAAAADTQVEHEPLQGKGHVVRRMFSAVEADVYVLVDG